MLDSDGQSFNVTWTAPPTLDITNTEPDISYHVDVLKIDPTTGSEYGLVPSALIMDATVCTINRF